VANRADAADIAQQTLLVAWAKLDTFRGDNLHAWLFAIARNLIADYYRSQKHVQFVTVDATREDEREPALRVPPEPIIARCDFKRRIDAWLERSIARLPVGQQVAVLLADVYEYPDKDSAAMLRMTVPSFKLLLHASRACLRDSARRVRPSGVTCRLGSRELAALQRKLVDGLKLATYTIITMVTDMCDVEVVCCLLDAL
jgi:RNA polymerase sigma-70 factor (ECF subfamily)